MDTFARVNLYRAANILMAPAVCGASLKFVMGTLSPKP